MKQFIKENWFRIVIVISGFALLTGWCIYNTRNYTFYYSSTEKKEIIDTRNNRGVFSMKLKFDDCFWETTSECYELMRALKFKGCISDKDWEFINEKKNNPWEFIDKKKYSNDLIDRAKSIRLSALNKIYDERAKEESEYKELKHFDQFIFEETLIFLIMASVLYVFKNKNDKT